MSHNIDKIIYINLEKRPDRRNEIETELTNFGLVGERFEAIDNPHCGIGCMKSHLSVLKLAKLNGYKNILILEDDFMFTVSKESFENSLSKFFELKPNFDVCMLSYALLKCEETEEDSIRKVTSAQTTSGYIVNHHYYDKLIQLYEWASPLLEQTGQHWIYANDQIWKQLQEKDNWYLFTERIGKQRPGYNNNGGGTSQIVDYGC